MKNTIQILILLITLFNNAQVPLADELVKIHSVTTTEMNAITSPIEGSLIYNTTDKSTYQRTNSEWINLNKERKTQVGHFIITGNQTINSLIFKPSSITFQAYSNIETEDIDDDNDTGNNNDNSISNAFQSMTGYATDSYGTIEQQVISVGGNANSINDISRYSKNGQCIGIRYANQNGDNLGVTSASLTSFTSNGFVVNVNSKVDNLLVIYTAHE